MEFERHTLAKAGSESVVQLATSPTSGDCVLQLLQRRRAAAVVGAWAGAAYDLWRCRKLVQSAALRSQCRMMSAAWNWWSNEVASSAAEAKTPTAVSSAAIEDPSLMDQVGAGTATSSLQKGKWNMLFCALCSLGRCCTPRTLGSIQGLGLHPSLESGTGLDMWIMTKIDRLSLAFQPTA